MATDLQERIIRYRAKHRLTQREMAVLCGISISTLNSVETDQQTPGKLTLAKIELVLEGDENGSQHIEG